MVLIPWGRVTSATARIIGTGRCRCTADLSAPVDELLQRGRHEPLLRVRSVVGGHHDLVGDRPHLVLEDQEAFVRAPTIESSRFPASLMAVAMGSRGRRPDAAADADDGAELLDMGG